MKVSINWAQHYSNVDLKSIPTNTLLQRIGEQLGAVEDVTYWGARYDHIVVAKIVSVSKHPNADKLNLCLIDDGGVTPDVPRDDNGLVQIVCGAPVVMAGMIVAWLTPGATVPASVGKDPFVLDTREIRGIPSPGMLGTPSELGLNDDHSGLLAIKPEDVGEANCKPGTPFKKLYGLDDVVIDCENKMFTHRPDCFGILGVARELAGISGLNFTSPDWYAKQPVFESRPSTLAVTLFNDAPDLVPRMMAVVIKGVKIGPSPLWLQAALARVGIKSINNVVDVTNFVMQLTGQPLHAFDYHKIAERSSGDEAVLGPRMAKPGEPLTVLGGKKLSLTDQDIVLATDKEPADLAGVIGGGETEVDDQTTAVLLTCASFDMYAIRRSSMRHGVFTEAASRYTKGQSPLQNDRVIAYAMSQILQYAGGEQDGVVIDVKSYGQRVATGDSIHAPVDITADFINVRLGLKLSTDEISSLLGSVEIDVQNHDDVLQITAPFWRTDIELREDVVEEVGRLYGYDKLPLELPARSLAATAKNPLFETRTRIRTVLSRAGANESLGYTFVHGDLLSKVGQSTDAAFSLGNALSPDLQYYRLSIVPSLIDKVHANVKAGYEQFAAYEVGKVHVIGQLNNEAVPQEFERIGLVYADAKPRNAGAAYYQARAYAERLLAELGIAYRIEPLAGLPGQKVDAITLAPFELSRSAVVRAGTDVIGYIGEPATAIRKQLKLPEHTAMFELDVDQLMAKQSQALAYSPLSKFPKIEQDMSLQVAASTSYNDVYDCITNALQIAKPDDTRADIEPIDIYQPSDGSTKNITLRIKIVSFERTLQSGAINDLLDRVATAAHETLGATRL